MCVSVRSGWYVDAGPGVKRHLRGVGAADPVSSFGLDKNHLLEVFQNQRPCIKHHIERSAGSQRRKKSQKSSI